MQTHSSFCADVDVFLRPQLFIRRPLTSWEWNVSAVDIYMQIEYNREEMLGFNLWSKHSA